MKRFYAEAVTDASGAILLDGRPVRTPARLPLALPYPRLGAAIAAEWQAQREAIDPRTMPLTGIANAAIDRVAPDPLAFAAPLTAYAETDLLCYRAVEPSELVIAEAAAWDPVLGWATRRYDIAFEIASGIVHRPQPAATVERLGEAFAARDAFALAAMSPLVTISGSLVIALALAEHAIYADPAFDAAHVDELWQASRWGEEYFGTQSREAKRRDFLAAARFLDLLDQSAPPAVEAPPSSPQRRAAL